MKYYVYKLFYNLGVHIGHREQKTKSIYFDKLIGFYKGRAIINIIYTIFSMRKALLFLKKNKFKLLFHISSLFIYSYEIKALFINLIYIKYNHALIDQYWFGGYLNRLIDIPYLLDNIYKLFKINKKFKYLDILKLLIHTICLIQKEKSYRTPYHIKKMKRFWRIFLAFKFLRNYNLLPNCFILLNGLSLYSPSYEISLFKVPVISTLDTHASYDNITYPIFCNDKNILFLLFLTKLFLINN